MKLFRERTNIKGKELKTCYYEHGTVRYGKAPNGKYMIEVYLITDETRGAVFYSGSKKPLYRDIKVINAVIIVPYFVALVSFVALLLVWELLTHFIYQCLVRKSFITERFEVISGYVTAFFYGVGLAATISWVVNQFFR